MKKLKEKWKTLSTKRKAIAIGSTVGGVVVGGVLTYFGVKNIKRAKFVHDYGSYDINTITDTVNRLHLEPTKQIDHTWIDIKNIDMLPRLFESIQSVSGEKLDDINKCLVDERPICIRITSFVKDD